MINLKRVSRVIKMETRRVAPAIFSRSDGWLLIALNSWRLPYSPAVGVRDDGEVDHGVVVGLDVRYPTLVRFHGVARDGQHLHIALLEFAACEGSRKMCTEHRVRHWGMLVKVESMTSFDCPQILHAFSRFFSEKSTQPTWITVLLYLAMLFCF